MNDAEEFRSALERQVRSEARHGWENARKRWAKPLAERIQAARAIGGLEISEVETVRGHKLVHFHPAAEDMALFREGDQVRMSLDDPDGDEFKSQIKRVSPD